MTSLQRLGSTPYVLVDDNLPTIMNGKVSPKSHSHPEPTSWGIPNMDRSHQNLVKRPGTDSPLQPTLLIPWFWSSGLQNQSPLCKVLPFMELPYSNPRKLIPQAHQNILNMYWVVFYKVTYFSSHCPTNKIKIISTVAFLSALFPPVRSSIKFSWNVAF